MKKTVTITCPGCNLIFTAIYGGLGNRTTKCPGCGRKIDIQKESKQKVNCPHCRSDVIYDALKYDPQLCPQCGKPLNRPVPTKYRSVPCPFCGQRNDVSVSDQQCTCWHCGKVFSIMPPAPSDPLLIEARFSDEYTMWQYCNKDGIPTDQFPMASHLIVPEGMTALLLRDGACEQAVDPGKYMLSELNLSLPDKLSHAMLNPDTQITVEIIFVRNQFRELIGFSDAPGFIVSADGQIHGKLAIGGHAAVSITDARKLAEFVGYKTYTEKELTVAPNDVSRQPSKLRLLLRSYLYLGTFQTVQKLIEANCWPNAQVDAQINMHKAEIEQAACDTINRNLASVGLKVTNIILNFISYKLDAAQVQEDKNWSDILLYTQKRKQWTSLPIRVHMKDDPAVSEVKRFKGTYQLDVQDKEKYRRHFQVEYWIQNGVSEGAVNEFCITHINELLKNVFPNVLQCFVEDRNADIRDLSPYYHELRGIAVVELNAELEKDGLSIRNFVLEEEKTGTP